MFDSSQFQEFSYGLLVFGILIFALFIQLWYFFYYFIRLAFYKKKSVSSSFPPASIIICAKNEDDNLVEHLPSIFSQDYPEYEVVVVNDCSWDNTGDILKEFANKHSNLRIVTIKEDEYYSHGKKVALMVGIKGAKYDYLVLTDADCKPTSNQWLKNMMQHFSEEKQIVLGYGAYEKQKGLLNKLIRFDTFVIGMQFLSFALARKTYMGTGRNMAYKKALFFKMKGFASHYHIESGDDDLFVNEAATKENTAVEISLESITISKVKRSFKQWMRQKRRHVTTFKMYSFSSKFRLFLLSSSQYLFFIGFVVALSMQFQVLVVIGVFVFRMLLQYLIYAKSMKVTGEKELWIFTPILEIILVLVYPMITIANLMVKKHKWK